MLFDYIRSQEIVETIDAKLDLREMFNRAARSDFVFSLGEDPSIEHLLAYWRRMVDGRPRRNAGIIQVRVNAFTPEDAHGIAQEILAEVERAGEPALRPGARGRDPLRPATS